jgi:hypothetical protein
MRYGSRMDGHQLKIETLKLLVQLAWADHEVSEKETEYILSLSAKFDANEDEVAELRAALVEGGKLPMPNLGLLRGHKDEVMQSIDEIIAIDDRIVEDEEELRDMVSQMLDTPEEK